MGVLGVDGGDHQALAQKQLVLHLPGVGVGRIVKGQRPEVGRILQHGLHEFTVEVGQKGPLGRDVAGADELPELLCRLCRRGGGDEIEGIVRFCRREAEGIVAGVADVIAHFAREIKEDADALAAIGRGDEPPSNPAEQERKPSERYNKTGIFAGKKGAGLVWAGGNGI